VDKGLLVTSMVEADQFQPASIDLTLSRSFRTQRGSHFNQNSPFYMDSHQFLLGSTEEEILMPDDCMGFVVGRSSWARKGLGVEVAGLVDPGFRGQLTLEMFNLTDEPLLLTPGSRICQMAVAMLVRAADRPYGSDDHWGSYQGQMGATPSVL